MQDPARLTNCSEPVLKPVKREDRRAKRATLEIQRRNNHYNALLRWKDIGQEPTKSEVVEQHGDCSQTSAPIKKWKTLNDFNGKYAAWDIEATPNETADGIHKYSRQVEAYLLEVADMSKALALSATDPTSARALLPAEKLTAGGGGGPRSRPARGGGAARPGPPAGPGQGAQGERRGAAPAPRAAPRLPGAAVSRGGRPARARLDAAGGPRGRAHGQRGEAAGLRAGLGAAPGRRGVAQARAGRSSASSAWPSWGTGPCLRAPRAPRPRP